MNIFGDITAELVPAIVAEIDACKASGEIKLTICSNGGDAFAGLAVYDLLRGCGLKVTTEIVGICASAASVIALAGDVRQMGENSMMMLHPALCKTGGNAEALRAKAEVLDAITARMGAIAASVVSPDEAANIASMMTGEVWLTAAQAMTAGIATETITAAQYAAKGDHENMSIKSQFIAFLSGKNEDEIRAFLNPKAELSSEETMQLGELTAKHAKACADMDDQYRELDGLRTQIAALQAKAAEETAAMEKAEADTMQARLEVFAAIESDGLTIFAAKKAIQSKNAADIRAEIANGERVPAKKVIAHVPAPVDILAEYGAINDPKTRSEFFAKHEIAIRTAAAQNK